jgi:hypothetical protein
LKSICRHTVESTPGGSGNVSEMAKWRQISYPLESALDPCGKPCAPFFMN